MTIPTVPDTVYAYARRFYSGDSAGWRAAPSTLVAYVWALLLVVPVSTTEWFMPFAVAVFGCVAGIDAAAREFRFGGPPLLIVVAGSTTGVVTAALLAPVVALRVAVGGPPLPHFAVVVVLATFGLLVAYFRPGWRERADAASEAEVREERARRGAVAVAAARKRDSGRQLRAYLFCLALGTFGLALTLFIWTRHADWLTVAIGVLLNGSLIVWAALGMRRPRVP